jgi:HSP20 family protein
MNLFNQHAGGNLVAQELWQNLPDKFSMTDLIGIWKDASSTTVPAINIRNINENMHIDVALPGLDKQDLDLRVNGNSLLISGKNRKEENSSERFFTREFNYSSFSRSIPLPENTDSDKITASYRNGILNIVVLRSLTVKTRSKTIKID